MSASKYGKIIALVTTVCVILLAVLYIVCCAHLFFTGGAQPYTRERVGAYLVILAVPSVITVGLMIAGVIYNTVTAENDVRTTKRTNGELLDSFLKKYDFNAFPEDVRDKVTAERDRRQIFNWLAADFSFLMLLGMLLYFRFATVFTVDNLNGDVLLALAGLLPLSVCAVGIHIPKAYFNESSCLRELTLFKESIKENGAPAVIKERAVAPDRSIYVKCAIAAISIVLIVLGIINGGVGDVLAKAVKICTECIGLG